MELVAIDKSAVVRLVILGKPGRQENVVELIRAIHGDFSFESSPERIEDVENSIEFSFGSINGIPITKLGIYNDGIVISSPSPTTDLDDALDHLGMWAKDKFGLIATETHQRSRMYESNITVKASSGFLAVNKRLSKVHDALANALKSVSGLDAPFETAGVIMAPDLQTVAGMKPAPFRVSRHANADFHSNLFQSTAPLPTVEHIKILELFEGVSR